MTEGGAHEHFNAATVMTHVGPISMYACMGVQSSSFSESFLAAFNITNIYGVCRHESYRWVREYPFNTKPSTEFE
jgi:hypothetical protein